MQPVYMPVRATGNDENAMGGFSQFACPCVVLQVERGEGVIILHYNK